MQKILTYIDNLDLKKLWIYSAAFCLIQFVISTINAGMEIFSVGSNITNPILILSAIASLFLVVMVFVLPARTFKKFTVNKKLFITLLVISFIFSFFYPIIMFLPVTMLTVSNYEKKVGKLKLILSTLFAILSFPLAFYAILIWTFLSDSFASLMGVERIIIMLWLFCGALIIYFPMIVIYGVILGNKKSWKYYLLPLITPVAIVSFFAFVITLKHFI